MPTTSPDIYFYPPNRGMIPNADPYFIGVDGARELQNWKFDDQGSFIVRPGLSNVIGTSIAGQRVLSIAQYVDEAQARKTVFGTKTGWHSYDEYGGGFVDITGTALTGGDTDFPVFRPFEVSGATLLLGVNGQDANKKWTGSGNYSDLGGSPPIARTMAINNNTVLLGNLVSGVNASPLSVDVSEFNNPESGYGTVQVARLADTPGRITAMLEIGNLITAIYKTDAIYFAIAQASVTEPFRFELRVPDTDGPLSPAAVIKGKEGVHYYLARDLSIRAFDGTRPTSISRTAQDYMIEHANQQYLDRAHGYFDSIGNCLVFFFISNDAGGPVWRGLEIDLDRNGAIFPFKFKEKQITASAFQDYLTIKQPILGASDGQVYTNEGPDDDGDVIPTIYETGLSSWKRRFDYLKEFQHGFLQTASSQKVRVLFGKSDYAEKRYLGTRIDDLEGIIDDLSGTIDELGNVRTLDLVNEPPFVTEYDKIQGRSWSLRYEADVNVAGVRWRGATRAVHPGPLR